jgi:hypothetical protein
MITKLILGAVGLTLCLAGEIMTADGQVPEGPIRVVASISGVHAQAILLALPALTARNLDLTRYEVTVAETIKSFSVLFQAPNRDREVLGDIGNPPGFEVEIDKKTHQILGSHYIR